MTLKHSLLFAVGTVAILFLLQFSLERGFLGGKSEHWLEGVELGDLQTLTLGNEHGAFRFRVRDTPEQRRFLVWELEGVRGWKIAAKPLTALVSAAFGITKEHTVAAQDQALPEEYGLGARAVTLELSLRDGRKTGIRIGGTNTYLNARYVQIAGANQVYAVPDQLFPQLHLSLSEFLVHRPFLMEAEDVDRVSFQPKGGEPLELQSRSDGWLVNGKKGDAPFVRQVVTDLVRTEANGFAESSNECELGDPQLTVELKANFKTESAEANNFRLEVGKGAEVLGKGVMHCARVNDHLPAFYLDSRTFLKLHPQLSKLLPLESEKKPQL